MKVPAILFGTDLSVRRHCSEIVGRIAKGETLATALSGSPLLETHESSSFLLLAKPGSPVSEQNHFIFYTLQFLIAEAIVKGQIHQDRECKLFEEFLLAPWSTLGLMCMLVGSVWTLDHEDRHADILGAFDRYWDLFVAEGRRYSSDLVVGGAYVYEVPSYLGPTLAYCGVPEEVIAKRLRSEGLRPLLEFVKNGN